MAGRNRRRGKPSDPIDAAAKLAKQRLDRMRNHAAEGLDAIEAEYGQEPIDPQRRALLEAKGVEIATDHRGRVTRSTKVDVWAQMRAQRALNEKCYNAIRQLEADMTERAGFGGAGFNLEKTDRSGDAAKITDRMVDAGARVEDVLKLVGPPLSRILQALVGPDAEEGDWRAVVERITGEKNPQSQSASLRLAAQSVADVYPQVEARAADRWNARKDRLEDAGNGHMRANAA